MAAAAALGAWAVEREREETQATIDQIRQAAAQVQARPAPAADATIAATDMVVGHPSSHSSSSSAAAAASPAPIPSSLSLQLRAVYADDGQWRANGTAGALHLLRRRIAALRSPPASSAQSSQSPASSAGPFGATAAERTELCAQLELVLPMWSARHSDINGWDIIETYFDSEGSGASEQDFHEAMAVATAGAR
jgi:hypothetical protein